jgi:hypothetical protein
VEAQFRMQAMVFPGGLSYADLEKKQTAQRSVIYDALADLPLPEKLAAPRCRVTNRVLAAMVEWYNQLRGLPMAINSGRVQ